MSDPHHDEPSAVQIWSVDGNIGAGKSTLVRALRERGFTVMTENVEGWGDTLTLFYDDPKRWSYLLQTRILADMATQYEEARRQGSGVVLIERSPQSAMIFVEESFANGNMSEVERDTYLELNRRIGWRPDRVIYVDTPPTECVWRMRARNRAAEAGVDESYIQRIAARYEAAMAPDGHLGRDAVVHRLDGRDSISSNADRVVSIVEESGLQKS